MFKRFFLVIVILIYFTFVLVGCGNKTSTNINTTTNIPTSNINQNISWSADLNNCVNQWNSRLGVDLANQDKFSDIYQPGGLIIYLSSSVSEAEVKEFLSSYNATYLSSNAHRKFLEQSVRISVPVGQELITMCKITSFRKPVSRDDTAFVRYAQFFSRVTP